MHYHAEIYLENLNDIEGQVAEIMAPYREELDIEFCDIQEEYREMYENESRRMLKLVDGRIISPYDDELRGKELFSGYTVPEGAIEIEVPHKEAYGSFEEFMEEYCGYKYNKEQGTWGYWHNPDSLWDWYQVGGRWTGEHDGYDPTKDPRNIETCWLCNGTGKRTDMEVENGCNGCDGTGKMVKWSTSFAPHYADVMPISEIREDMSCFTLIINGEVLTKEKWDGENWIGGTMADRTVKKVLADMGITDGYLVTVDYHC